MPEETPSQAPARPVKKIRRQIKPAAKVTVKSLETAKPAPPVKPSGNIAYVQKQSHPEKVDYVSALAHCDLEIKLHPQNPRSYYDRAMTRMASGDLNGALNDMDKVLTRDDDYSDAFFQRAGIREKQGDRDGARLDYEQALEKAKVHQDKKLQAIIGTKLKASGK